MTPVADGSQELRELAQQLFDLADKLKKQKKDLEGKIDELEKKLVQKEQELSELKKKIEGFRGKINSLEADKKRLEAEKTKIEKESNRFFEALKAKLEKSLASETPTPPAQPATVKAILVVGEGDSGQNAKKMAAYQERFSEIAWSLYEISSLGNQTLPQADLYILDLPTVSEHKVSNWLKSRAGDTPVIYGRQKSSVFDQIESFLEEKAGK